MKRRQMIFGIVVVAILVALFTWNFSRGRQSTEKLDEEATVRSDDALSIRGGSVADSEEDVREWVQGLGYQKTAQTPQEELPAPGIR